MVIKVVIPCPDLHKLIVHKKMRESLKLKLKNSEFKCYRAGSSEIQ
jgi:hypothetical protein